MPYIKAAITHIGEDVVRVRDQAAAVGKFTLEIEIADAMRPSVVRDHGEVLAETVVRGKQQAVIFRRTYIRGRRQAGNECAVRLIDLVEHTADRFVARGRACRSA